MNYENIIDFNLYSFSVFSNKKKKISERVSKRDHKSVLKSRKIRILIIINVY